MIRIGLDRDGRKVALFLRSKTHAVTLTFPTAQLATLAAVLLCGSHPDCSEDYEFEARGELTVTPIAG